MKSTSLLLVFLISFCFSLAQTNLTQRLFELPDVIFQPITSPHDAEAAYKLQIKQPIDHENPSSGYFYQVVWLTHRGFDRPNVLVTNGYYSTSNNQSEVAELLQANQFSVEHRYFGNSSPDSMMWEYLNLKQVASDLHRVRYLLGRIYSDKWISTGISKGGQTTIFYRYFYPEDVAVSIPYVAPLNLEFEDPRIYTFLDTVGTDACRKDIKDFQIRLLKNRDKLLPLVNWYAKGKGLSFKRLGLEKAFELTVLEFPFSFWQWGGDCADIPDKQASIEDHLNYLFEVIEIDFFGDTDIAFYASHYYQAATEMGYYGYRTDEFSRHLKALPLKPNPHAAFSPIESEEDFDPSLIQSVDQWLRKEGNKFIYLYGANDTWSATRVTPSNEVDAISFVMEGKHHGSARIRNLSDEDRSRLMGKLEEWLELTLD